MKREIQFYKKLYSINNRQKKQIKKYKEKEKEKNNAYNYYNNQYNINSPTRKIYKLYEPYNNKSIKIQNHQISNSNNTRNSSNNKYNIYLQNRRELYKGLYKNLGNLNGLPRIASNNSCLNIRDKNGIYNQNKGEGENKYIPNRNKLSPIMKNAFYIINE